MFILYHNKKKSKKDSNKFLINVTFLGSAGPFRFFVNEDETIENVIDKALKRYASEGRLPLLGSDSRFFLLYCPCCAPEAFSPWGKIGQPDRGTLFCLRNRKLKRLEDLLWRRQQSGRPMESGRLG